MLLKAKPFIGALMALAALLAIASCADSETEPTATETPTATREPNPADIALRMTEEAGSSDYETCYKPTEKLQRDFGTRLTGPGIGGRAMYLLRHSYRVDRWTLAADLEGPGFEGMGPIAFFTIGAYTVESIDIENLRPFNDAALDNTDLDQFLGSMSDDAYKRFVANRIDGLNRLEECIAQELTDNPETPVYRAQ